MQAVASISQSALTHNLSTVKQFCAKAKVVSMVKADAYGHRVELVDPIINESDLLAVSELSEAQNYEKKQQPIYYCQGLFTRRITNDH